MVEENPMVVFEMRMSPEDYVAIKKNADWEGKTVAQYMVDNAMGRGRRGC
jgi:uncharacterized protein (DUF1778 family)